MSMAKQMEKSITKRTAWAESWGGAHRTKEQDVAFCFEFCEVHSGKRSSEASEEGEDQVIWGLIGFGVNNQFLSVDQTA